MQYQKQSPTGRVIGSMPNLQQLPKKSLEVQAFMKVFAGLTASERQREILVIVGGIAKHLKKV